MTWMALGNNVRVEGDIARRVYQVRLKPNSPNPENRRSSDFRHPDFRAFTKQNRNQILTAILTLIRAWYAAGSPNPRRGVSFGSFETWEKTMGGILDVAGISGFLDNQDEFRSESSTENNFWVNHLVWLSDTFGDKEFTTRDVHTALKNARSDAEAPPNMEDLDDKGYTRKLGLAYAKHRDRYMGGYRLVRNESKVHNRTMWRVESPDSDGFDGNPDPDDGGNNTPTPPSGFGGTPVAQGPTGGDAVPYNADVKDVLVDEINVFDLLSSTGNENQEELFETLAEEAEFLGEDDMSEDFDPFASVDNESKSEYTESMTNDSDDEYQLHGYGDGITLQGNVFFKDGEPLHGDPHTITEQPESVYEKNATVFDPVEIDDKETVVFDIETADADKMWTGDHEGDFVRLNGYQADQDDPIATVNTDVLVEQLTRADEIIGHNIIGFDLVALAKDHDAPYSELADKSIDTLLVARQIDPPAAKGMPNGYYSLDTLAKRLGVEGKSDDLKALAREFGGFDKIPADDARYVEYLKGDLNASRQVYDKLKDEFDKDPYIKREHRVQSRMAQVTLEGFKVDTDELDRRLEEQRIRKGDNLKRLSDDYGVPLFKTKTFKTKDPVTTPVKSPLATRDGKDAVIKALKDAGAPIYPTTEKSGDLSTNKDRMNAMLEFYKDPARIDSHNQNERMKIRDDFGPHRRSPMIDFDSLDVERIEDIVKLVTSVTGERSVYQTIKDNLTPSGRVHPRIFPDQASGRWSVTRPGLTVLGKRGGKHYERGVLIADEGCVLRTYDLDQVDARAIAAHSKDPEYLKNFEPGMDLHSNNAMMAFGRADGEWRDRAKILGHGFNYGLGPQGAANQTGMPLEIAQQFHEAMRQRYWVMEEWKGYVRSLGESGELLDNGFGRKMRCNPDRAYTQAPALVGQGATRDIIAEAVLRLPDYLIPCMRAVIHDEIVFNIPVDMVDQAHEDIMNAMQFRFLDTIDITAGASVTGTKWSDLYEK
jgi:DNA polymerase-1